MNDCDLLKAYAETKSEDAFAELVRRHVDLVFSAALRQVGGDQHRAQDVVQCVFNDLARKAGSLSARVVLAGWLYTSARFAAAKIVRTEQRRLARERESHFMHQPSDTGADPAPDWDQLKTVLDEAMHDLKETDRNAIVLRYFQGCDYHDVAEQIGASRDGARMRVDRAIDKLRKSLAKRGVISTSAALAVVLAQQSLTAAPAGFAAVVASSAISATVGVGTAVTFFQFMAMTKMKAVAFVVAVAGFTVPMVLQHQANQKLEETNRALQRQHAEAVAELEPLETEVQRLNAVVAQTAKRPESSNEIFQLRAEVARLRDEARLTGRNRSAATGGDDPVQETLRSLGLRAEQLKKRLAQMPETQIPELALVSEKDWIDAAATVDSVQNDYEARKAFNALRASAKQKLGNDLQKALRKFAEANGDMLPTDLNQLQPFLDPPIDPSTLQRYQMARAGKYSEGDGAIVQEIAPPVDPEYDTTFNFFRDGTSSRSVNSIGDVIENAATLYAEANNGRLPRDSSELAGFLPREIDPQRVQDFLAKIPPNITTLDQLRGAGKRKAELLPAK